MITALISPSQPELEGQATNSWNADDGDSRGEIDLLIVDDHRATRYSLWALLSWKRDIRVTDTANSSAEALRLAAQRRPHACLISATLAQGEALTLASRIKHLSDPPSVLIFADAVDQHLACAASLAGADGVLWRYADPEEQIAVVRRATSRKQQFPDLQPSEIHALLDQVEDRDRAIAAMLLERTHPDDIASLLGLGAHSLELRRQGILKRLGPTCGLDDRRQDERAHRGPLATEGSRETRPAGETAAPARKTLPTSDQRSCTFSLVAHGGRISPAASMRTEPSSRVTQAGTTIAAIKSQVASPSGLPGRTSQAADGVATARHTRMS